MILRVSSPVRYFNPNPTGFIRRTDAKQRFQLGGLILTVIPLTFTAIPLTFTVIPAQAGI